MPCETEVFEGPFDLLLHLILSEEVDLYEINLCDIVDAYLVELDRMQACDLDVATEFLLIAATLVELKSRRLLPELVDPDLDEELALWEERDLLLSRLLECKTFKDASTVLARLADDGARVFPRSAGLEERFVGLAPDLLAGIEAVDLRDAMHVGGQPAPTPGRPRPRGPDPHQRDRRRRGAGRRAPSARIRVLHDADVEPGRPPRRHRAVPGRAGAVQERLGRARPGHDVR